jgi:hypothetical protein
VDVPDQRSLGSGLVAKKTTKKGKYFFYYID